VSAWKNSIWKKPYETTHVCVIHENSAHFLIHWLRKFNKVCCKRELFRFQQDCSNCFWSKTVAIVFDITLCDFKFKESSSEACGFKNDFFWFALLSFCLFLSLVTQHISFFNTNKCLNTRWETLLEPLAVSLLQICSKNSLSL